MTTPRPTGEADLLPCPFCGERGVVFGPEHPAEPAENWMVGCQTFGCRGIWNEGAIFVVRLEAVENWNRRRHQGGSPPTDILRFRADELRALRDKAPAIANDLARIESALRGLIPLEFDPVTTRDVGSYEDLVEAWDGKSLVEAERDDLRAELANLQEEIADILGGDTDGYASAADHVRDVVTALRANEHDASEAIIPLSDGTAILRTDKLAPDERKYVHQYKALSPEAQKELREYAEHLGLKFATSQRESSPEPRPLTAEKSE
jgi:hypothetical protein